MSLAQMMHFLQDMFQMTAIALISVINHYHINGLHLFRDTHSSLKKHVENDFPSRWESQINMKISELLVIQSPWVRLNKMLQVNIFIRTSPNVPVFNISINGVKIFYLKIGKNPKSIISLRD